MQFKKAINKWHNFAEKNKTFKMISTIIMEILYKSLIQKYRIFVNKIQAIWKAKEKMILNSKQEKEVPSDKRKKKIWHLFNSIK
jgi:hypothetical protein